MSVSNLISFLNLCLPLRAVHSDDGPLLPEEEDWIFCHPDVYALLHDSDSVPGVVLAKQRIGSREDRLR